MPLPLEALCLLTLRSILHRIGVVNPHFGTAHRHLRDNKNQQRVGDDDGDHRQDQSPSRLRSGHWTLSSLDARMHLAAVRDAEGSVAPI